VSNVTGIDAPFGWPRRFAQTIAAYAAGAPWPRQRPEGLWLCVTDQRAQQIAGGRASLSVSSDRIARPAERAARLLTLLGRSEVAAARDGSDGVIEVYPAGALRCWGIPTKGYKRPGGAVARDHIVIAIETGLSLELSAAIRSTLVATDHALDALVAALVARGFQVERVIGPSSDEERAAAAIEGWLFLPLGQLAELR